MTIEKFRILGDEEVEQLSLEDRMTYFKGLGDHARQLERDVYVDTKTGLYNRRYFDETLEREFKRAGRSGLPLGLALGDLDHFKQINDTYGHLFGDFVLRAVGQAIQTSTRKDVDSACRAGGEEFGIILPYTSLDGAAHLAEHARQRIKGLDIYGELEGIRRTGGEFERQHAAYLLDEMIKKSAASPPITMSFGVGVVPYTGITNILGFYTRTDDAMYLAKASGRNCVKALFDLREL